MIRASVLPTDPVDRLVRQSLRALAEERKVPPLKGFQRLVKIGLIDAQGRLNRNHVEVTTLGELANRNRRLSIGAVAKKIGSGGSVDSSGALVVPPRASKKAARR
jgi:hypothetical protein